MARAKGLAEDLNLNGRIGDLVFYKLDGKLVVRRIGRLSKRTYREASNFKSLRENQNEFGLSSQLAKVLRQAMHPYIDFWKVPTTSAILTGAFRKIVQQGEGVPGQRSFSSSRLDRLDGIGLDPDKARLCIVKNMKLDPAKGEVYLRISYGKIKKLFSKYDLPIQLIVGVIALSRVEYEKGYKVLYPQWHGRSVFNTGKVLGHWPEKGELRLKVGFGKEVPEGVGIVGVFGVMDVGC